MVQNQQDEGTQAMKKADERGFREYSLSGNQYRLLIQVGTPLAIFALFNGLFTVFDTIMASHIGTLDVSTVSYMSQLRMILNALGSGLITGSMILVNRAYGAGDEERTGILLNALVRLIMMLSIIFILMIPFVPMLLSLIGTPEEFIEEGTPYFRILLLATAINFINLLYINIEKARGNTKIIMLANITTMVIKLGLSALFIYVLEKGIVHIALATLITYSLFALYSLSRLFDKESIFRIRPALVLHGQKGYAGRLLEISYPVAIEDSAFSLGKTVVNSLAAAYGATMIGALGISNSMCGIAAGFENGFSDASSAIVSQNYGAGRYGSVIYAVDDPLIRVFATSRTGLDASFMDMIRRVFIYDSLSSFGIAINGAGMDFLLGLGRTRITLVLNFTKIFILRIPVLLLLQRFISDGATALGIMMMISNCGIAIPTTIICVIIARGLLLKEKEGAAADDDGEDGAHHL